MKKSTLLGCLQLATAVALAAPGWGQEDSAAVHGYGRTAYGNTDGNRYSVGDEGGSYENSAFALNLFAHPLERLTVAGQVEVLQEGESVELDFAFAQWSLSDAVSVRLGRVKQPFGIYTEIYDVGTLRPFFALPQSVYGPSGFISEAFNGLAGTGRHELGGGWRLSWDAYFGEIDLLDDSVDLIRHSDVDLDEIEEPEALDDDEAFSVREAVGGRVLIGTPLRGLELGASFYTGTLGAERDDRQTAVGAQLRFDRAPWQLRSEVAHGDRAGEATDAFYVEASRRLPLGFELAARYDRLESDIFDGTLGTHEDLAFGLNYWIAPGLVLKGSYHAVEGNRFASAGEGDEEPAESTRMVVVGVQFAF